MMQRVFRLIQDKEERFRGCMDMGKWVVSELLLTSLLRVLSTMIGYV